MTVTSIRKFIHLSVNFNIINVKNTELFFFVMSALFDFSSLLVVILLFICATTFARSLYPTIFNDKVINKDNSNSNNVDGNSLESKHSGLYGLCWKASRIGERLSPYVAAGCIVMAIHILFLK